MTQAFEKGFIDSNAQSSIYLDESDALDFNPDLLDSEHEALFLLNEDNNLSYPHLSELETDNDSARADIGHLAMADSDTPIKIEHEPCEPRIREILEEDEVVVLSDSEDEVVHIKKEPIEDQSGFNWSNMPKNIDLSDDDEVHIKQEEIEAISDWKAMGQDIIDLMSDDEVDQPLGQSFLRKTDNKRKRPTISAETMQKLQDRLKDKIRQKQGVSGGASNMFHTPSADGNSSRKKDETRATRQDFSEIKNLYAAKKKQKLNTLKDDIEFQKAQDAELADIRRRERELELELEHLSEEDGDGLFVPQETGLDAEAEPSANSEEMHKAKPSIKTRKRKANPSIKLSKPEMDQQLALNMQAGMPESLQNELLKLAAPKTAQSGAKMVHSKRIQTLLHRINPKQKQNQPNLANIASLTGNDFFDKAEEINDKESAPLLVGKDKRKAMKKLIASIPLQKEQAAKARGDGAALEEASKIIGNCRVSPDPKPGEGQWTVKGMLCGLHAHQVQGVARMKERELEAITPAGILADDMGLGKTIQSMALMISNPPQPDEANRATLVVCSPALLSQWDEELSKRTDESVLPLILRHNTGTRMSAKNASGRSSLEWMKRADVVLTTYSEVMKSYPKYTMDADIEDPEEKRAIWKAAWDKKRGLLHRVHWRRVIVDEAAVMKNYSSFTSKSCRALMGKYRWAISGTPIMNNLGELYPYFKFLQIPYTGTYRVFQRNFCGNGTVLYLQRLHAFLDQVMIRRVYEDELFGRKLVNLPKMHHDYTYLNLNMVEGSFYDIISARYAKAINAAAKEGEERKKDMIIRRILRLRQITSHLLMLQEYMERAFDVEDIDDIISELEQPLEKCQDSSKAMILATRAMIAAKDEDDDIQGSEKSTTSQRKTKTLGEEFRAILRALKKGKKWPELQNILNCQFCGNIPSSPMITTCMHLYCRECIRTMSNDVSDGPQDHNKCVKCDKVYGRCDELPNLELLQSRFNPEINSWSGDTTSDRPARSAKDNLKWCTREPRVLHSTKSAAVARQIETWLTEFPRTKIVVFSQFHLFIKIVEKECEQRGWKSCSYHGEMSHQAREEAIEKFRDEPEISIMIASLMCGGIGLNLTMAQRIIIVDLWWNNAMERQAFCRVFRIGQTQETYLMRMVVNDSVDQKLLKMQKRKSDECGKAMDNRDTLFKMSVEDLMGIFGDVRHDQTGTPFIYSQERSFLQKLRRKVTEPNEVD